MSSVEARKNFIDKYVNRHGIINHEYICIFNNDDIINIDKDLLRKDNLRLILLNSVDETKILEILQKRDSSIELKEVIDDDEQYHKTGSERHFVTVKDRSLSRKTYAQTAQMVSPTANFYGYRVFDVSGMIKENKEIRRPHSAIFGNDTGRILTKTYSTIYFKNGKNRGGIYRSQSAICVNDPTGILASKSDEENNTNLKVPYKHRARKSISTFYKRVLRKK